MRSPIGIAVIIYVSLSISAHEIPHHLREECNDDDRMMHPILCAAMDRIRDDPLSISNELYAWANEHNRLVDVRHSVKYPPVRATIQRHRLGEANAVPVVFAHGMGDSCFNSGMQRITARVSTQLNGVYSTCIATGSTHTEDTNNGSC